MTELYCDVNKENQIFYFQDSQSFKSTTYKEYSKFRNRPKSINNYPTNLTTKKKDLETNEEWCQEFCTHENIQKLARSFCKDCGIFLPNVS